MSSYKIIRPFFLGISPAKKERKITRGANVNGIRRRAESENRPSYRNTTSACWPNKFIARRLISTCIGSDTQNRPIRPRPLVVRSFALWWACLDAGNRCKNQPRRGQWINFRANCAPITSLSVFDQKLKADWLDVLLFATCMKCWLVKLILKIDWKQREMNKILHVMGFKKI
jgi:hypothetical protein